MDEDAGCVEAQLALVAHARFEVDEVDAEVSDSEERRDREVDEQSAQA